MNIIICDDNLEFLKSFKKMLITLDVQYNLNLKIFSYSNTETLINKLTSLNEEFILFLDIEFENESKNGIQVINNFIDGSKMCGDLYYLTNYPNFVFDSFNTHPENYILKPLTIDNLCRILLKAVRNISEKKNKKFIECRSVNSIDSINIQINKIVYIELISSPKRIIKIVTSKNLFLIHGLDVV
ncbi:response regulator [Lapidilactobacillus mulanensis]|nr:hypothetical protein [Lapidilactobacillus mulanensis]